MQLRNHIAWRFLMDPTLMDEFMERTYPQAFKRAGANMAGEEELLQLAYLYDVISPTGQKAYYVTDTVIDKLDLLKVSQKDGKYDYTVFKQVPDCKLTFIFRQNCLLRMRIKGDTIHFCHLEYKYYSKEEKERFRVPGQALWVNFFVNRLTGEQCDHFNHIDVRTIERFVYHLLCFFFLSENTEIVVQPGKSYGTKKQADALCNDVNVPVTIVNSNWNITSIRTEGFGVSGHFRLQPCGPGLNTTKMILIEPFQKHGYTRKAKNLTEV
jgi:hypothetical protein